MRTVVTYAMDGGADDHERATQASIARSLARVQGFRFGGEFDPSRHADRLLYFVPSDTLLADQAHRLGIRTRDDLFGGVVPFEFMRCKAIVHPLVAPDAFAPRGWSDAFAERVRDVVLPGFTAFTVEDTRRAANELLPQGPVRLKPGQGVGGHGQAVIRNARELERALENRDRDELQRCGAAIEMALTDVTTYSIGEVSVGDLHATYAGTQQTTRNNAGGVAFGGSDLRVVRGAYGELSALPLAPDLRLAIEQAQRFNAATAEIKGLFASRRNYDAVRGRDREGRWRCGIVEQSWRIGGASGAELAALTEFRQYPEVRVVHVRCVETYGNESVPPGAIVHFRGIDSRVGPMTKYTVVQAYASA